MPFTDHKPAATRKPQKMECTYHHGTAGLQEYGDVSTGRWYGKAIARFHLRLLQNPCAGWLKAAISGRKHAHVYTWLVVGPPQALRIVSISLMPRLCRGKHPGNLGTHRYSRNASPQQEHIIGYGEEYI